MYLLSKSYKSNNNIMTDGGTLPLTGTMLGLCSSVQSLLRTVGPTVGGFLYVNYGVSSIGTVQFVVNVVVFLYLLKQHLNKTPEHQD